MKTTTIKVKRGTMTRCGNARKYKALKPPTCGCDMCNIRWEIVSRFARLNERLIRHEDDHIF